MRALPPTTLPAKTSDGPVVLSFCASPGESPPEEDWDTVEPFGDFSEPDVYVPDEEAFPEPGDFWIDDDDWDQAA